jgi:hypothetical protein
MEFKYGFEYLGVRYGWNKKQLYRLPFTRNKRTFELLNVKPFVIGSTTVYNVQRTKLTMNKLKQRTKEVGWSIKEFDKKDCPF